MKNKNGFYILFALLDLITFIIGISVFIALANQIIDFHSLIHLSVVQFVSTIVQFLFYLSLPISFVLLLSQKKLALTLYYGQFVLRLIYRVFSIGFILYLGQYIKNETFASLLLITAYAGEVIRLIITFLFLKKG